MKLYTEEQVKYFFECGRNFQMNGEVTFSDAQKEITPIELLTDEEINERSYYDKENGKLIVDAVQIARFRDGAKWLKDIILNQLMDNLKDKLSNEVQNQPSCLGAVSGSLPLETKLEMFYDFLYERGIANQLGVGIDTVVKHFIDEKLLGNDR